MTIAQHSSATPEHYTPAEYIEAARIVMGGIDLDPATTWTVNNWSVKASSIYTKESNGLIRQWHGRVWLNPPGGKVKNKSNAALWWAKGPGIQWAGSTPAGPTVPFKTTRKTHGRYEDCDH